MKSQAVDRKWDIVVLGASGFTGKFVANYLAQSCPSHLKWALAGRSKKKLDKVVQTFNLSAPIEIVDVHNETELDALTRQTRLILSCVGPYFKHGEPVVKSCAKHGTHYIDITGEPLFMEEMMWTHHPQAQSSGAIMVHACGFDSLPSELGVMKCLAVAQERGYYVQSIDAYIRVLGGFTGHVTTLESGLNGLAQPGSLRAVRKKLRRVRWARKIPRLGEPHARQMPFIQKELGSCYLTFVGPDASVVKNSQYQIANEGPTGPLPWFHVYFDFRTYSRALAFLAGSAAVLGLGRSEFGRRLILDRPEWFTGGTISKNGPTEKQRQRCHFRIDFLATGTHGERLHTSVSGPEPGYEATPILMVQAGLAVLEHEDTLPTGINTPGAVFSKVDFLSRFDSTPVSIQTHSPNL